MTLFDKLARVSLVVALGVVVLGAWVRLTDAGLGCPDWPGCYGQLLGVPDSAPGAERPLDTGKAWREVSHRYLAGLLGLLIFALAALAVIHRREPGRRLWLPLALALGVVGQALLGMWTVTLLLQPLVVVAHLLGGFAIVALLWWLCLDRSFAASATAFAKTSAETPATPPGRASGDLPAQASAKPSAKASVTPPAKPSGELPAKAFARPPAKVSALGAAVLAGLVLLGVQIALGGWTSANYAALACPDFPLCNGQWWPQADFADGFRPRPAAGVDYEHGVLDSEARVAVHFVHRLGALLVTAYLACLLAAVFAARPAARAAAAAVALLLAAQVALGVSNVVFQLPLAVAVSHNAVAALLFLALLALARVIQSSPPASASTPAPDSARTVR